MSRFHAGFIFDGRQAKNRNYVMLHQIARLKIPFRNCLGSQTPQFTDFADTIEFSFASYAELEANDSLRDFLYSDFIKWQYFSHKPLYRY